MNLFKKLLETTGLALIFKPRISDEDETRRILAWINEYLVEIIEMVFKDIDADLTTSLQYIIKDRNDQRLELPRFSLVSCNGIKMTGNYQRLKEMVSNLGYSLELREINIDDDGLDTDEALDDPFDDFERYFSIQIYSDSISEVQGSESMSVS